MNNLMIVLRLIHIIGGMFWIGSTLLMVLFILPSVNATMESGQRFLGHFLTKTHYGRVLGLSAILTMLAGASLYWIDSAGFSSNWTRSGPGWGFGIGGILGVIGFILGNRFGNNIMTLGRTAATTEGTPTAEQKAIMEAAQKPLRALGAISTFALLLALICMATARYWRF
jgi:uncharacterized membrane protein